MKALVVVDVPEDHMGNVCVNVGSVDWEISFNAKLKPMPEKYEGNLKDYEVGWNDALEELENAL